MTKELREKIVERIKFELDMEFEPEPFIDGKTKAQWLAELFVEIMNDEILKTSSIDHIEVKNG